MSKLSTIRMISWNIWRGGFDSYNSAQIIPGREKQIKSFIEYHHRALGVDTICLTDAYRWRERYGSDEAIAKHLGYRSARLIHLNDKRVEGIVGPGAATVFATDHTIVQTRVLNLENRQALGIILSCGSSYKLQIASVYLDDLSEDTRVKQARALLASLEKDLPTIITGDFNTLRPTMHGASPDIKVKDSLIKALAHLAPKYAELNRRQVVPLIQSSEFVDADERYKRPTVPAKFPAVGVDYAFHSRGVRIEDFRVLPTHGESDHRPILFKAVLNL